MRYLLLSLALLCGAPPPATAQVSVNIGINLPLYPELVLVPGYPVYYAPRLPSNFFFYDGYYWVYADDDWFVSSWYNGPWEMVEPEYVPLFVLRVPVRYYRSPPPYFRSWHADAPPRWGERWGNVWEREHHGWDRWDRHGAPAAAPLPLYQRQYPGARYPRYVEQQQELHDRNYRYQPRDPVLRHNEPAAPAPRAQQPSMRQPDSGRDARRDAPRDEPREYRHDDQRAPQPRSDRQPEGRRDHQRGDLRGDQRNEQRGDQRDEPRHETQQPGGSMRQPGASSRATVMPEPRPVPYQATAPHESAREPAREPERQRSREREPARDAGRDAGRDSGRDAGRDSPRGQSRDQDDDRQPGRR